MAVSAPSITHLDLLDRLKDVVGGLTIRTDPDPDQSVGHEASAPMYFTFDREVVLTTKDDSGTKTTYLTDADTALVAAGVFAGGPLEVPSRDGLASFLQKSIRDKISEGDHAEEQARMTEDGVVGNVTIKSPYDDTSPTVPIVVKWNPKITGWENHNKLCY